MKEYLKILLIMISLIGLLVGCTSSNAKMKESKKATLIPIPVNKIVTDKVFAKEVEGLRAEPGIEKAKISWNISDISDVQNVEILSKQSSVKVFKSMKIIPATEKEIEIPIASFIEFEVKVRLIAKDGSVSDGVVIKNIFTRMKNVVYDKCEGREMQIYLPSGYETSNERYPVVYMHDGQNLFSRRTAPNGEWMVDETMDKLIADGKVEKMIVVGIYNSNKRIDEYMPYDMGIDMGGQRGGKSDVFAEFMVNKIIPYIDGKYKTIPTRENRAVMGSSAGGILSFWMGMKYSDLFSMVGAFSPSMWIGNGCFVKELKTIPKKDMKIWVDMGSKEFSAYTRDSIDALISQGYVYGKDVVYYEDDGAEHNEEAWARRMMYPLMMFKGINKEEKLVDFTPQVEIMETPFLKDKKEQIMINPFAEFSNGMKYTLYDGVTFSATGNAKFEDNPIFIFKKDDEFFTEDTPINMNLKGNINLNGDNKTEVTVSYRGIEKKIVIDNEKQLDKMVKVEGGSFNMGYDKSDGRGNELPVHKVSVDSFYIGKYEVTFEEFDKYTDTKGKPRVYDKEWGRGRHPVMNVSLAEIKEYLNWLNEIEKLPLSYNDKGVLIDENGKAVDSVRKVKGYRLPTEAEWEFAAGGGTKSKGYRYSGSNDLDEVAWYDVNSNLQTAEVGLKKPNELGIYDMSGNVWEWCADNYDETFYGNCPGKNPFSIKKGAIMIYRGGSWLSEHENLLRTQFRFEGYSWQKISNLGFRVVKTAE